MDCFQNLIRRVLCAIPMVSSNLTVVRGIVEKSLRFYAKSMIESGSVVLPSYAGGQLDKLAFAESFT